MKFLPKTYVYKGREFSQRRSTLPMILSSCRKPVPLSLETHFRISAPLTQCCRGALMNWLRSETAVFPRSNHSYSQEFPFEQSVFGVVNFEINPADVLPEHEIALHGLNVARCCQRMFSMLLLSSWLPESSNRWHNEDLAWDVNGDKHLSPLDALIVINFLNQHGTQALSALPGFNVDNFVNTINDQVVSPLDALMVINELNSRVPRQSHSLF